MRVDDQVQLLACIPHLRRYARALLADAHLADDLVQDTLERACWKLSFWQRRSGLRAWTFSIMHNLFVDRLRSDRLRAERPLDEAALDMLAAPAQHDRLELRDVDRVLQRLPVEQRSVLLLVAVEELSYEDVARILEIPVGTVMSRLSRAREAMRGRLGSTIEARREPLQRVK